MPLVRAMYRSAPPSVSSAVHTSDRPSGAHAAGQWSLPERTVRRRRLPPSVVEATHSSSFQSFGDPSKPFSDTEKAAWIVVADVGLVSAATDLDELPDAVRRGRVYAGFSGWGPGQLETELEEEAWIVEPPIPPELFPDDPSTLWSDVLERKGGQYALVARMPDDPSLN